MKKNILVRTNIIVCIIITLGFLITSVISYRSNMGIFVKDVEQVSELTLDGIYNKIDSIFSEPVSVSVTMANDSLLKEFLSNETSHLEDEEYIQSMKKYLDDYRAKYGYDSVFLVSAQTNRYYHFNGIDRVLTKDSAENDWYYNFLQSDEEYSLNIDNDEARENEITVFINGRIKNPDGTTAGIVGVGFQVDSLQELLKKYENEFGVRTYLIDQNGTIEVSTNQTGYEQKNLFAECSYGDYKDNLLEEDEDSHEFWYSSGTDKGYVTSRYIKNLGWHLIVENDTVVLEHHLNMQLFKGVAVIVIIIFLVLYTITAVIRRYNGQIIELTTTKEREYYEARQEAVKQIYDNIHEMDITHNCAAGAQTRKYFESLGIDPDTPYDEALKMVAQKQIREEFRQGYLDTFSRENVKTAYDKGIKSLSYDFMIKAGGSDYYWVRIMACIYYWSQDQSLRITMYRQNIDDEKQQQNRLFAQMQSDPLTGIYNKAAVEEKISEILKYADTNQSYAFFIIDIDNFKIVNDTFGHEAGDRVIEKFAHLLSGQFSENDIVGRIGGDEFVVFASDCSREEYERKGAALARYLHRQIITEAGVCQLSASIGAAVYPEAGTTFTELYKNADTALYETKDRGKNGCTVYASKEPRK